MKHENDLVAKLLVSCLQEQIAKERGLQTCLRCNYKLNGRYFRSDHSGKTDLDHSARMVYGMANEMSLKEFLGIWGEFGEKLYKMYNMLGNKYLQKND